ncbi:SRPBCC family protein [Cohnella nanjingensis]|uniref:SRPBCC family protein n=1 Tax=Cohnella nanjingensis TaxID=1387779 RepID=A0A7X0VHJ3_9BACL|nr:SRPBCC family protein [Cohnella nanjingensis]MBB6673538.1 SRPBCC family protein [Cohnella nanjingensis]
MKFKTQAKVAVSKQALWEAWADVPAWPKWDTELEEAILDGGFAVGAEGRMKSKKGGVWSIFRILAIEPARGYTCVVPMPGARLEFHRTFREAENGELEIAHELDFRGPLGWLYGLTLGRATHRKYPTLMKLFVEQVKARDRGDWR